MLHLETACSLLDEATLLATDTLADSDIFEGLEVIRVSPGEALAANALRVNEVVLLSAAYPRTAARLRERGFTVEPLPLEHVERLDAGLSCLSLRWHAG